MPQARSAGAVEALALVFLLVVIGPAAAQPKKAEPDTAAKRGALGRLTHAVEGAESSYGTNPRMWRAELRGPQGPMQVSAAAAADVGGGDRFDSAENVVLGRAYLAHMYHRFRSWPDAVAAYNWGPGNLDSWIRKGRSPVKLPSGVARYRNRVLAAAELPLPPGAYYEGSAAGPRRPRLRGVAHAQPRGDAAAARAGIGYREIASLYGQLMQASAPGSR